MDNALISQYNRQILTIAMVLAVITASIVIVGYLLRKHRHKRIIKKAEQFAEITPQQFFYNRHTKGRKLSSWYQYSGVYILKNNTKQKYYVGQAKNLSTRVNQHFTGHGNGDVYADYKMGDKFTIRMIALYGSGYKSLNQLERYAIDTYACYSKGYNKTRGNKN